MRVRVANRPSHCIKAVWLHLRGKISYYCQAESVMKETSGGKKVHWKIRIRHYHFQYHFPWPMGRHEGRKQKAGNHAQIVQPTSQQSHYCEVSLFIQDNDLGPRKL